MLRLKFLRLERGLSQDQLAAATGYSITQPMLSQIESGRFNPTRDELTALADVLGCPTDRLLDHVSAASLGNAAEFRETVRS